ncbi:hypothetical protein PTTG_28403 [Puccinia triticina 1-1 BBBD Race 1]|uniref:Uncharacterized protein n=2 Tax=Puccinia triticina TaxID=208348 RepID=A0A180GE57_PUCT1|nr:uncharacterized protein PtA15_3A55 [Puccinia triticina]OAV90223.1 hypothetical protein PTTG_28403 [Puccinia triticina 1-1 BBBD Race 1]WAQ82692.1 hypothetical protein PtA15_3A55 [Puccinia triticina]WAR53536.1 hypothetical protein PtB15_3B44 [Puccinia triticina]
MSSIFSRRHGQTFTRTGRSTPDLLSSNASKLEQPKNSVNSLYHLDVVDSASVIIPSVLTYPSPQTPEQSMSPVSTSSNTSVPSGSQRVPPPTTNISSHATNPASAGPSGPQRHKRAPTPPPPYVEHFPSQSEADNSTATPVVARSRSRTPSTSSWIKRVVSRSSSRASLRKQYQQIPMSEEEKIEAEQIKARKEKEALAEWNRINDALKAAGF